MDGDGEVDKGGDWRPDDHCQWSHCTALHLALYSPHTVLSQFGWGDESYFTAFTHIYFLHWLFIFNRL